MYADRYDADAVDRDCEEEAKRRGYKDYTEWFVTAPALETYEYVKESVKRYTRKIRKMLLNQEKRVNEKP